MNKPNILLLADISGKGVEYHVGDEAMAEVAIERLAQLVGKQNLIMGCSRPEKIYETYGIRSFAFYHTTDAKMKQILFRRPWSYFRSLFRILSKLVKCDVVFICGGGNMTSVWPEVLEARLRLIKWANRLNKDVYLVSQTLGPYTEKHRSDVEKTLINAKWVGVRDKTFSKTQVNFPVNFAVDDACFLPLEYSQEIRDIENKKKPYCCVSMRYFGEADDNNLFALATAVSLLASNQGLNTIFIPHHAPGGDQGDIKLAKTVSHAWSEDRPLVITDPIPMASQLKALTAEAEWVVTMRYHQLIFALSTGVPVVGVYVNEYTKAKLRGAFEQFDLEPKVVSITTAKEKLAILVESALQDKENFINAAQNTSVVEKELSMKAYLLAAND